MKEIDVRGNLCYYDVRNPYGMRSDMPDMDIDMPEGDCFCDTCFRGKSVMANEILRLRALVKKLGGKGMLE